MKKIRKSFIILGAVLVVILVGVAVLFINMNNTQSTYRNFDYGNLDLSTVEDGTYLGEEDGGIVKASIEVTVKDHIITKVTILSHDCGTGKPAEVIVDDIVAANSLDVDTVSGATYSSNVIRKAVYNALTK